MKTIRMGLIGYGNVGRAFARMLKRREDYIRGTFDAEVVITAISRSTGSCVASRGTGIDKGAGSGKGAGSCEGAGSGSVAGIDIDKLRDSDFDPSIKPLDVINGSYCDVIAELTPLNIRTGEPAITHIRTALENGIHVITANKGPIAWAYRPLRDLARERGVMFLHEATVMDGIPVYNLVRENMMGCKITEVSGILNSTTNYILTEVAKGVPFDDAVREGQRRGFVEADPSMDLEGYDAAAKLTSLMNVLMDVFITPDDIDRTGIGGITKEDIERAAADGMKYKLICRGRMEGGRPVGTVKPELVPKDSLYGTVDGIGSCVTVTTDLMGAVTVVQHVFEPEIDQTAYGVLSDLLRILKDTSQVFAIDPGSARA